MINLDILSRGVRDETHLKTKKSYKKTDLNLIDLDACDLTMELNAQSVNRLKNKLQGITASQALSIKDYKHISNKSFLETSVEPLQKRAEITESKRKIISSNQSIQTLEQLIEKIDEQVKNQTTELRTILTLQRQKRGF